MSDTATGSTAQGTEAASGQPARRRKGTFILLSGAMVFDSAETNVANALFPAIRSSLGLSLSALGLLVAAGKLVTVVAGPFWVWVARRTSRKAVLIGATGAWGLWSIAAGFSQNFTQLLILYTIIAAGAAAGTPIVTEILGDLFNDADRGRAVGMLYGALGLGTAILVPLMGQLTRLEEGWRYGFFSLGGLNLLLGLCFLLFFRDPGLGSGEHQLAGLERSARERRTRWADVARLLRMRTFLWLLVSRLFSGHLLLVTFGVVFLTDVHGFGNAVATLVLGPYLIGVLTGSLAGGWLGNWTHRLWPSGGRIAALQSAQFGFAAVAFAATQFDWEAFWIFGAFFFAMGTLQSLNPGLNRPVIMAVTPPELRGPAFAIFVSVVEAIAYVVYSLAAGYFGAMFGLQVVFLVVLVILMSLNGAVLTLVYRPYRRESAALQAELDRRAAAERTEGRH